MEEFKRDPTCLKSSKEPYLGFWRGPCRGGGRQSAGASASREEQATGSTCMVQIYAAPVIAQDPSAFCLTGHIEEENSAIG